MKTKILLTAVALTLLVILTANMLIFEYKYWFYEPVKTIEYPTVEFEFYYQPTKTGYRNISQFNVGDPLQTDDSPCISANGENICTAVALGYNRCASNEFEFGTRLKIRGLGECIVVDRMNSRYQNGEIDWALPADQKQQALNFGRQKLLVIIK